MSLIKPEQLRSGSYSITGSFSGSFYGDGSGLNNLPIPIIDTSSLVTTASFNAFTSSINSFTASYNTGSFTGSFTGSLNGTSSYALTASYLTGYVSPFPYTGSALITGSLGVTGSVIATSFTGSLFGTASWANNAITASYVQNAVTASYVLQAVSSSFASTASFITSSGVYGPYGSNSILSASYADTASISLATTENRILVLNQSGQNIAKGVVVHITASGNSSDIPRIITASYENDNNSANTLGITSQLIANGSTGYVTTEGVVLGINTNAFQSGQLVYLGATGSIIGYAPAAPLHSVRLGQVIRHQSVNGSIYVRVDNGYELSELHDVLIDTGSLTSGQSLVRSGSVWINSNSLTGSLFGTASYATVANSVNSLNQNVFISGSLTVLGGATIYGSSSFQYITASQLEVSASFISVNVFEPVERFGGLKIYDSGSSTATASFAWDSLHNHFVYQNVSGSTYNGGMFLSGPRNTGSLGDEPNLTKWYIARSDGGDHLNDTQIYSSGSTHIVTGSLTVTDGITGSLFGTASWANNAITASYIQNAQTASYVLNAVSSSYALSSSRAVTASLALTASYVTSSNIVGTVTSASYSITASYVANASSFPFTGSALITGSLGVTGSVSITQNVTASRAFISSSNGTVSGSTLTVYGSGSAQPVFTVQGSQGELFSVTDSLSGSLYSVNDISGLPILEVFSDNTVLIGNYLDPMLITTAKVTQTNSGSFVLYSLPTASYDTAFFEYSVKSGSNARAGTIMAIQSGSAVNFTETTTTDFGSTSAISFTVVVTGSNMALTGSSTSGAWTIKTIVRGL